MTVSTPVRSQLHEPPDTEPYVRWCGRTGAARLPSSPIQPAERARHHCYGTPGGKTGIVNCAAAVSRSLCRLCPWLYALLVVPAPRLKTSAAPSSPSSAVAQNFNHPDRPAEITVSTRGVVRGKLPESIPKN